jgi:hypothetical protein
MLRVKEGREVSCGGEQRGSDDDGKTIGRCAATLRLSPIIHADVRGRGAVVVDIT